MGERRSREARDHRLVPGRQRRAIKSHRRRLEPVRRIIVVHRLRIVAEIVKRLSEAEVNGDARLPVEVRLFGKNAHALDQGAVGVAHALHKRQIAEGGRQNVDSDAQVALGFYKHPAFG